MKSLTNILKAAKIYDPKLDPQIKLAERLEKMVKKLQDELDKSDLLIVEINASGTEKTVVNPIVPLLQKYESQLQGAYEALGLNYNINPQKIHEAKREDDAEDGFSKLMETFG